MFVDVMKKIFVMLFRHIYIQVLKLSKLVGGALRNGVDVDLGGFIKATINQ